MSFCAKCGRQLEDKATFCDACGAPINQETANASQTAIPNTPPPQNGMGKIVFRYRKNAFLYWNIAGPLEIVLNNGVTIFVPENNEIVYNAPIGNYYMIASIKTFVGIKGGIANQNFSVAPNQTYIITYKPPIWFSGRITIEKVN